ncbi:hypothetical protein FHS95_001589 [Sphingomonas naasensis]|uniref:Peptidase C13 n=1 Tax=Sphingomonas naasensis TaxID=1344951 RepID=A0A4S1WAS7_9SPHN|nr:C13 family peptidase [Sphingomonas naasensis]NIJ19920.1 hypothetical protein [Sphingomonas naasensis]TGX39958.1 peptidase C13 [Sphingomonas naasensis]
MRLPVGLRVFAVLLLPVAITASAAGQSGARQSDNPPRHTTDWPNLPDGGSPLGPHLERGRPASWELDQQRRLTAALAALRPQRKGVIDAYIVAAALDSDPVFGREAREAGKVLSRRYDAVGRSIVLAGADGRGPSALAMGTPRSLALALARVAAVMDKSEDVLVLYLTSHGAQVGIAYHDGDEGFGLITPRRFAALLDDLGIRKRVLILSACYSGIFVPVLTSDDTALLTAASSDRTSFGCRAENDWTFFGDALVNHALRKPQSLGDALVEARETISDWEMSNRLPASNPQVTVGEGVEAWLAQLEARMPKTATAPVGAPATDALKP